MLLKTKVYETGFGHMKKKDLMIFLKKLLVIKYMKMFQDVLIKVTVDEKKKFCFLKFSLDHPAKDLYSYKHVKP